MRDWMHEGGMFGPGRGRFSVGIIAKRNIWRKKKKDNFLMTGTETFENEIRM